MLARYIKINNEEHYNQLKKALESKSYKVEKIKYAHIFPLKYLKYNNNFNCYDIYDSHVYNEIEYKNAVDYEVEEQTTYELKEVASIVCNRCGKKHYKDSETYFKFDGDFVVEKNMSNYSNISYEGEPMYFCRECLNKSFIEYIEYVKNCKE